MDETNSSYHWLSDYFNIIVPHDLSNESLEDFVKSLIQ